MENVEGLLTNGSGLHVRDAVRAFLQAGYSINLEKSTLRDMACHNDVSVY